LGKRHGKDLFRSGLFDTVRQNPQEDRKGGSEMKLILPLSVTIPRKTKADRVWILNLNSYRNTHFQILNKAKEIYKEEVKRADEKRHEGDTDFSSYYAMPNEPYLFTYTVFPANNRKFDLANVLPIIQKFTDDALIEFGIISDDSYKVIQAIDYRFGGVDKENPRVELEIRSLP
jgi:hypothetical protein